MKDKIILQTEQFVKQMNKGKGNERREENIKAIKK